MVQISTHPEFEFYLRQQNFIETSGGGLKENVTFRSTGPYSTNKHLMKSDNAFLQKSCYRHTTGNKG